jgi:hypothetical protein
MRRWLAVVLLLCCGPAVLADGNFTGPTRYTEHAEQVRRDLGVFWTGKPLRRWAAPCPINVVESPTRTGGSTTFILDHGEAYGWRMDVTGSPAKLLATVIPHEVNHTVLHSLTRTKIPRWLDEGVSQLFESKTEHQRHRQEARRYARHPWAAWRRMDHRGAYPRDVDSLLALYSTGFTVVEWMLEQRGRDGLYAFVADTSTPMAERWVTHYGTTAADAERAWLAWMQDRPTECSGCRCYVWGPQHHTTAKPVATLGQKPRLNAVGSITCLACLPFSNDFAWNQQFKLDLTTRVDVLKIDGRACRAWCDSHGVRSYPAFVLQFPDGTHSTFHGYPGRVELVAQVDGLLRAYRRKQQPTPPPTAPPPPVDPPPTPTTLVDTTAPDTLAPVRQQLIEALAALAASTAKAEAAAAAAKEATRAAAAATPPPQDTATPPPDKTPTAATPTPTAATPPDPAPVDDGPGFPWLPFAAGAASLAGVGLPVWGVYAIRAASVARRLHRRRDTTKPPQPDTEPACGLEGDEGDEGAEHHYVVDAPEPPARHRIDTRFVNVENDSYQRAHEQARAEVARRYPGSQEILEAELSLTRQFLAGDLPG